MGFSNQIRSEHLHTGGVVGDIYGAWGGRVRRPLCDGAGLEVGLCCEVEPVRLAQF
jgi:hypothetical protein